MKLILEYFTLYCLNDSLMNPYYTVSASLCPYKDKDETNTAWDMIIIESFRCYLTARCWLYQLLLFSRVFFHHSPPAWHLYLMMMWRVWGCLNCLKATMPLRTWSVLSHGLRCVYMNSWLMWLSLRFMFER